jgi:hypothetical protein
MKKYLISFFAAIKQFVKKLFCGSKEIPPANLRFMEKLNALVQKSEEILQEIKINFINNPSIDYKKALILSKKITNYINGIIDSLKTLGFVTEAQIINLTFLKNDEVYIETEEDASNVVNSVCIEILKIIQRIEAAKSIRTVDRLHIEDISAFKEVVENITPKDIDVKYTKSAFLEDDVEEALLEIFGEPYKENDSDSELRDFKTTRISINGKRVSTVGMLKGRGVSGKLTISNCGANGNQLLKLSKNTTANLFIIQHVNDIAEDVIEAMTHHLLINGISSKIYVCFIDGLDTARILKGLGRDLDELAKKKSSKS